jgi:23S rRNA (uracil1939-C5)-methyltransferase
MIELVDAHGAGRRRVSLHARRRNGKAAVGFMAAHSHDLVAIDVCPVLAPELASAPRIAHSIASQFIAAETTFDILLTATATGLDCNLRGLGKADRWPTADLARLLDRLAVIRLSIDGEPLIATAKPMIECGRASVPLPPGGGFLQATAEAERILAHQVLERMRQARNVADLFCGIGPFALRLAEHRPVTAIDIDAPALAALDFALRHTRGLKPITTQRRDLFREPLSAGELAPFDAVIFDPPRQGADTQARQLAQSRVQTVIAVSCDAATFARDAATLISGGYRLSQITPLDQFRWSSHIEIVATFTRGLNQA